MALPIRRSSLISADGHAKLPDEDRGGELGRHHILAALQFKDRIEPRGGRRCFIERHQGNDEAGAEIAQQIGLTIEQKARAIRAGINIELRHQNWR